MIQFIDARHEIQKNDYQMREWVENYNLPVFTVVTKTDCIPRGKIQTTVAEVKKKFGGDVITFSAEGDFYNEKTLEYLLNLCK